MVWKYKPIGRIYINEAIFNYAFDSDVKTMVLTVYEYDLRTIA